MALVDIRGDRPRRPLRDLLAQVTEASAPPPPSPAPAPTVTGAQAPRPTPAPKPVAPAAGTSPNDVNVSIGDASLGNRWWNRGKPPSQWTPYPPPDLPQPGTPAPAPAPTPAPTPAPAPAPYQRTLQNMPKGVDATKWLSGHVSPKYAWKEVASQFDLRTEQGRASALAAAKAKYPQYFANATLTRDMLDAGANAHADYNGITQFDAIEDMDGLALPAWQARGGPSYVPPAAPGSGGGSLPAGTRLVGPNGATFPLTYDANGNPIIPQGYQVVAPSNFTGGNPGLDGISGQLGGQDAFDWNVFNEAQYDDPNTQMLEDFTRQRIEDLLTTPDDPALDDLVRVLTQRFGQLAEPGSGANPAAADLDAQAQRRITELEGDPFSDTEEDQMQAAIYDDLERRRAETKQRVIEEMAAMGHGRKSGTIREALDNVDERFDQERARAERDLGLYMIDERQRRRGEALDVGQTRVDNQGREIERGENRLREALAIAGQVAGVSGQQRGEREGRADQALTLVSMLSELDDRAFQRAMQALGMADASANPSAIFQNLLQLSTARTQSGLMSQANSQNMLLGLGQMFGYMYANQGGAS